MAKIYSAPDTVKRPKLDFKNIQAWREDEERYINEIKTLLVNHNPSKNVGEVVHFPHADGYACYMVGSMKPLALVHLEIGDAWEYPYIERLTAKDIQQKIDQQNSLKKIFTK